MKFDLDIIIPVFNEGKKINKLYDLFNQKLNINFRLIVCYDYEDDNTLKNIKQIKDIKKQIFLVKNNSVGPNEAIKTGIEKTDSKIILVYMADDLENIELINKMYNLVNQDKYDLIIPSRFINGGKFIGASFIKSTITKIGSFLIYYIGKIPFKDSTNAFKMFKRSILNRVKLKSTVGFTYALELTIKSYKKKFRIIEVPSIWIDLEGRKSKFKLYRWLPSYIYLLLYAIIR